ncbi:hypothetical protein MHM83_10090 [Tenacibaculum sp. Mcav3-52]|uniref:hypothetical protein n=1 Tax=Tenacibaculum sp. Mcav3-52 TaxID=2917762 RepID=UPI001EF30EFB|nr:hypothetical protein [Tenacibaculum sp. Mcav3-52]MCG7502221.1 hypothetical protein [Tenacibaculum sp. Mcav3-52]
MIKDRITSLKTDLIEKNFSIERVLQKHIIEIEPFLFTAENRDLEYNIRTIISKALQVHLNEVVIVGSAKIGYSLSPKKLYNEFDEKYKNTKKIKDKSDIDIAVISPSLFDSLNKTLYNFTNGLKDGWIDNEYYKKSRFPVPLNYQFYKYSYKGWFRPDFKPSGFEICKEGNFEELKREIQELTGRKLGLGIYKNWYFFKNYHIANLEDLKLRAETEIL